MPSQSMGMGLGGSSGGGASVWGEISGTLSDQTDLQTALNGKQSSDGDLTAIAALSTTGFLRRTGTDAWTLESDGLLNFTESVGTAAPNNTINVAGITPNVATTSGHFAIIPKGSNGGITTSIADGTAVGGNAIGDAAISLVTGRSAATQGATGNNSIAMGYRATASGSPSLALGQTTASGGHSMAVGYSTVASGGKAIAQGYNATASGASSVAIGDSATASGASSIAIGDNSSCDGASSISLLNGRAFGRTGVIAYAPSNESFAGDSQIVFGVYRNRTTDATPTLLTSNSATTASAANIFVLQDYSVVAGKIRLTAIQRSPTNVGDWEFEVTVARGVNAAATAIKNVDIVELHNDFAGITPDASWVVVDTTLGGFTIQVTGLAATNLQWVARFDITENKY